MSEEIRSEEAEAQEQSVPTGDEEAPIEGEAPEKVELTKAEWDAFQKKLQSHETTVSKNKSRARELEEIKQVLRDRDENNKKRFREYELKLARLADERRGIEFNDEPESEFQRIKRQHEEEDAAANKTAQEPNPDLDPEFLAKARQADKLMRKLGFSEEEQERFIREHKEVDKGLDVLEERYEQKLKKEAAEAALQAVRQSQKASGATKGDGQPSAAGLDDSVFLEAYARGESNDHKRAMKLLGR